MDKTNKNPIAKAERLTKIPRNKHKEKNQVSFTKKARTYSKSEKMMLTSVQEEKHNPKIKLITKTNTVEAKAKATTVKNLESTSVFCSFRR